MNEKIGSEILDRLRRIRQELAGGHHEYRSDGGYASRDTMTKGPEGLIRLGRNGQGDLGLLIPCRLQGKSLPRPARAVKLRMETLQVAGAVTRFLIMDCLESENSNQFLLLCTDLLSQAPFADGDEVITALEKSIERFRSLLFPGASADEGQATGLLGELLFAKNCAQNVGIHVRQWTGPDRESRDFDLGGCHVEIKTTRILAEWKFEIHGIQQLATTPRPLALVGLRINESDDGETLGDVADWLRRWGWEDRNLLEEKLSKAGFEECQRALGDRKWKIMDWGCWRIVSSFPRIEKALLDEVSNINAIEQVRYTLNLTGAQPPDEETLVETCNLLNRMKKLDA